MQLADIVPVAKIQIIYAAHTLGARHMTKLCI